MSSPSLRARTTAGPLLLLAVVLAALWLLRPRLLGLVAAHDAVRAWMTTFTSMSLQALPFLVFGVLLSAAITVLVPEEVVRRVLAGRPALAVPVAGTAGIVLPGCECASVPVSSALMGRGVAPAAALAFQLAAPAVNPVVLASTAVAFGGDWRMVLARFLASWTTAVVVGWAWAALGLDHHLRLRRRAPHHGGRAGALVDELAHDVLHAGGYLVIGAAVAATVSVVVPREWVDAVAQRPVLAVLVLALLAVLMAVCSEADAFVAAGLSGFSPLAQLVFLVVGPVVDLKLVALQVGTYGRAFAVRFVPLTLAVAVAVGCTVGSALL